jgi:NAD(P)-dependent dehydrogenase (short-subunit alcohol dehydrogenase family)
MTNKTVIVTGASRGLGAATASVAAELGANVVLNARSATALEQEAQLIRDAGGGAVAVAGDVSHLKDCRQLVEKTMAEFGRVDAVINNAGILEPIAPLAEADAEAWQKNLIVNVLGPMMLTQAALPHLRRQEGRVVNVSSGAANYALPGWSAYCVAKGGLNQLNRAIAAEEAKVTAVAVRPGVVDTEMQAQIREEGEKGMPESEHARFVNYQEQGDLLPPHVPGRALAVLALHAPHEWSGEFLSWDDDKVQALVERASNR